MNLLLYLSFLLVFSPAIAAHLSENIEWIPTNILLMERNELICFYIIM